jgi:hypothetical protein
MNKVILFLVGMLSCTLLEALYFGNPMEPEIIDRGIILSPENWASARVGYEGNYVFNRRLEARDGSTGGIDEFQYLLNQGVATVNFLDRFEVYGSFGAMSASFSNRPHVDHKRREYQTNDAFSWGVGGRAELFHWGESVLGVGGSYQFARPPMKWNTLDGVSSSTSAILHYGEWQVGVGMSHRIDPFIPYIAVLYSHVGASVTKISHDFLPHSDFKMVSREHWGLAMGCSFSTSEIFDLGVEVRLFDEEAISLAGSAKF